MSGHGDGVCLGDFVIRWPVGLEGCKSWGVDGDGEGHDGRGMMGMGMCSIYIAVFIDLSWTRRRDEEDWRMESIRIPDCVLRELLVCIYSKYIDFCQRYLEIFGPPSSRNSEDFLVVHALIPHFSPGANMPNAGIFTPRWSHRAVALISQTFAFDTQFCNTRENSAMARHLRSRSGVRCLLGCARWRNHAGLYDSLWVALCVLRSEG